MVGRYSQRTKYWLGWSEPPLQAIKEEHVRANVGDLSRDAMFLEALTESDDVNTFNHAHRWFTDLQTIVRKWTAASKPILETCKRMARLTADARRQLVTELLDEDGMPIENYMPEGLTEGNIHFLVAIHLLVNRAFKLPQVQYEAMRLRTITSSKENLPTMPKIEVGRAMGGLMNMRRMVAEVQAGMLSDIAENRKFAAILATCAKKHIHSDELDKDYLDEWLQFQKEIKALIFTLDFYEDKWNVLGDDLSQ